MLPPLSVIINHQSSIINHQSSPGYLFSPGGPDDFPESAIHWIPRIREIVGVAPATRGPNRPRFKAIAPHVQAAHPPRRSSRAFPPPLTSLILESDERNDGINRIVGERPHTKAQRRQVVRTTSPLRLRAFA